MIAQVLQLLTPMWEGDQGEVLASAWLISDQTAVGICVVNQQNEDLSFSIPPSLSLFQTNT